MSVLSFLKRLFKNKIATEKLDIPFKRFSGEGFCDVCNSPLKSGEAYIVPKKIFYTSEEYKKWLANSPFLALAGEDVEAFINRMMSMDSTDSAVCSKCVHMFITKRGG